MSCDTRLALMCIKMAAMTRTDPEIIRQAYDGANAAAAQQELTKTRTDAQRSLAGSRTHSMMALYRAADIKVPTHAPNGIPEIHTHAGHAAMYALLRCAACGKFTGALQCMRCEQTATQPEAPAQSPPARTPQDTWETTHQEYDTAVAAAEDTRRRAWVLRDFRGRTSGGRAPREPIEEAYAAAQAAVTQAQELRDAHRQTGQAQGWYTPPVIVPDSIPTLHTENADTPISVVAELPNPTVRAAKDRLATVNQWVAEAENEVGETEGTDEHADAYERLHNATEDQLVARKALWDAEPMRFGSAAEWHTVEDYIDAHDDDRALVLYELGTWADADIATQATQRFESVPRFGFTAATDRVLAAHQNPDSASDVMRWMQMQSDAMRQEFLQANATRAYDPTPLERSLGVGSREDAYRLHDAHAIASEEHFEPAATQSPEDAVFWATEYQQLSVRLSRLPYVWSATARAEENMRRLLAR